MQRRSSTIVLAGLLALVLGAATTVAALRGRSASASPRSDARAGAAAAPVEGFKIPEGKRALAVSLDPVAGTAGIAKSGSRVDVFAAVSGKDGVDDNAARMVMQAIEVLRVDGNAGESSTTSAKDALEAVRGSTVFVLAVTPAEAEKLVFHASFSKLWFSVVPEGTPPATTPGVTPANQLQPEAA